MEIEPSHLSPPTAIVLAGGLGTRLRQAVADRPKVLAEVRGRPFLHFVLQELHQTGIQEVILCVSYLAGMVQQAFGDSHLGMALRYSVETEPMGTGGALAHAFPLCSSSQILVLNGDSLFRTNLRSFFAWHLAQNSHSTMLLAHIEDASRFGRVTFREDGQVMAFVEKDGQETPGWINSGIYLLDRAKVAAIPRCRPISLEREVFPRWVQEGFLAYCAEGLFLDIGTPSSYRQAETVLAIHP